MDANKKADIEEAANDAAAQQSNAPASIGDPSSVDTMSAEVSSVEAEAPTGTHDTSEPVEPVTPAPVATAEEAAPVLDTIESVEAEAPTNLADSPAEPSASESPATSEVTQESLVAELAKDEKPADETSETTPAAANPVIGLSLASANTTKKRRKRRVVVALTIGLLLIAGGVVAWQMFGKKLETVQTATVTDAEQTVVKLGVTTSLVDGSAQLKTASGNWEPLRAGQLVSVGDSVHTADDGRAVLSFDDGSALRLDAATTVRIDSLDPNNIQVTQLEGIAYSRVVPSERVYAIIIDDIKYTAQGTAFATVNSDTARGVQVYESAVKVDDVSDAVAEGKQYYKQNQQSTLVSRITDISLADLEKDSFIKWNIAEDKKVSMFKEKLGILAQVKSVYNAEKDGLTKKTTSDDKEKDPEPSVALQLNGSVVTGGVKLSWGIGSVDVPNGFKIVRSATSQAPTFGYGEATYVSDSKATSYTWKSTKTGTYWYRICAYQASADKCTNYSNSVKLTVAAPKTETKPSTDTSQQVTRGTMLLAKSGGKYTVAWTYTGKAVNGYKLVYSKDHDPEYGKDAAIYLSDINQKTYEFSGSSVPDGAYYVRVCAYTGSGCVDYSNEIRIFKP